MNREKKIILKGVISERQENNGENVKALKSKNLRTKLT